ncbi:hypothetical protein [Rhizobium sp. L43]|uniref:hypothetical protein n=1 Tax=Rhizobium sp. L43 TaxID=2035452 RepID=UPI00117BDB0C|nr:hypothetical protein [Rhizobium sp. L43]
MTLNPRIIIPKIGSDFRGCVLHFSDAEKSLQLTKEISPICWTSLPILFIRPVTPRSQARTGD